jgi:hypothetical protein
VSPPLAGVGEVICGRVSDGKDYGGRKKIKEPGWLKRKRVSSIFFTSLVLNPFSFIMHAC